MFLPKLPYATQKPRRQDIQFGGLNLTEARSSGQFAATSGISTRLYPVLSPRLGRAMNNYYPSATTIFAYDGLVVVSGTDLYYDSKKVGTVSEGKKQFAVVNTKLCIWPDKRFLDLASLRFGSLEATLEFPAGSVTFTETGFSAQISENVINSDTSGLGYDTTNENYVTVYTALSWDSGLGWTKVGAQEKPIEQVAVGDLIIPNIPLDGTYTIPVRPEGGVYPVEENDIGIFLRVTDTLMRPENQTYSWERYSTDTVPYTYYTEKTWDPSHFEELYSREYVEQHFTGGNRYLFSRDTGKFTVLGAPYGDPFSLKGSRVLSDGGKTMTEYYADEIHPGQYQVEYINHNGVAHSSTRTVKGSRFYGVVYGLDGDYPANGEKDGYWYTNKQIYTEAGTAALDYEVIDASGTVGLISSLFKPGDRVRISGCEDLAANNTPDGSLIEVDTVEDRSVTLKSVAFTAGVENAGTVVLRRPIPDMDYICASNNRLWGVSNADRTIYASALGDPTSFFEYGTGEATASYAVAVGTDGDWTGICAYSGGVLCWKEDVLHKVVGSYPADYQVYEYQIAGVQDGSWDSLVVINETLYYKGVKGVYAFNGGTPSLISSALGDKHYKYATAGGDDLTYRISMQDPDGSWKTYVYDIRRGMWVCADTLRVFSYTNLRGNVMALSSTGEIFTLDVGDPGYDSTNTEERIPLDWYAELVPYDDTSHVTKGYSKLLIRLDMEPGTWLRVYIREDTKPWRLAANIAPDKLTKNVPIRLGRCDRFTVRFEGHGNVQIRSLAREFSVGSDVL